VLRSLVFGISTLRLALSVAEIPRCRMQRRMVAIRQLAGCRSAISERATNCK
jgi:hypothetical protein